MQAIQWTFYFIPTFFRNMGINLCCFATFMSQQVLNIA
jgi:hypothetical protein